VESKISRKSLWEMTVKKESPKIILIEVEIPREVLVLIKNREVKYQEKNFCRQKLIIFIKTFKVYSKRISSKFKKISMLTILNKLLKNSFLS
jgi:hypothetical protein